MSAYALVFFADLAANNTFVDTTVIQGLANYLYSRRDGKGNFNISYSGSTNTSFNQATINAYVSYALTFNTTMISTLATVEVAALKTLYTA